MPLQGRRLTVALVCAVVFVLVVGSGAALAVSWGNRASSRGLQSPGVGSPAGSSPGTRSSAATRPWVIPRGASSGRPTSGQGSATAGAALPTAGGPPTKGTPSTLPGPAPTYGPSTNLTVQVTTAALAHPRAADVQQVLQSYFDAINQHDYGSWTQVVTASLSRHETSDQWLDAYASTTDSSIWVQSISASDPLRVVVRFTSQQDPDLAPKDLPVSCIDWTLGYQLQQQGGALLVGSTVPGSVVRTRC